ncbi:MAG: acyl-phosphate glycerol 3-phosphate acyltransferase [Ponticaulis sp.]|nr:acyl-phosphate glycerol 3-phosphate acyltransferase [Ponticaulis sp.]
MGEGLGLIWGFAGIAGYLLGSIPFGLVITRLAGLGDIRAIGSGNIGATNVLRTGRKDLALATLLLDSGKAGIAALIFQLAFGAQIPSIGLFAGAMAFVGHCFPVWLQFKGGKGVATYAGLLIAGVWKVALFAAPCWILIAFISRRSSLAALITAALVPIVAWGVNYSVLQVIILIGLSGLLYWRHMANIKRLIAGTEPKIGEKSKKSEESQPA